MVETAAQRGREVRERLLHAATELIAERGWTAVSTRLVAERAGVAPGLVHYHYASLRALLAEAAIGAIRSLVVELDALLEQAATPDEALESMLGALDGYAGTDPTSLLFAETYLAATRDGELGRSVGAVIDGIRRRLTGWLAERGVPQPEETAAVLVAAIDGVMLHRPLVPGLTRAAVAPVLGRLLTATGAGA